MLKKIILFGGSFDPVHAGHVCVAKSACKSLCADEVVFIPARCSPHKSEPPGASGQQRFEMIELAIKGIENFSVCDYELLRDEPSYTLNTVKYFRQKYDDDVDLHWLVGADMIADLHRWYEIDDLIDICNLSVMYRGGCDKPDFSAVSANFSAERLLKLEENIILTPLVDISSTEVRRSVRKCESIDQMVASAVADYIADNSLYSPL